MTLNEAFDNLKSARRADDGSVRAVQLMLDKQKELHRQLCVEMLSRAVKEAINHQTSTNQ